MIRKAIWRLKLSGFAALAALAGCATHVAAVQAPDIAPPKYGSPVLSLAMAAGERIRKEQPRGFAVLPVFLTSREHQVFTPDDTGQHDILEAFRDGARALYVDTLVTRDTSRLRQLPDSARYFYTLSSTPVIAADTGTVEVFLSVFVPPTAQSEISILQYVFQKDREGRWVYKRRKLVYAT
jgi:hypothetical protein